MTDNSYPDSEGFVSPSDIFESFETDTTAAEELEARGTAMADQPGHERAGGELTDD